MKWLACVLVSMGLLPLSAHALGRSKQVKAIQSYCDELDAEFSDATPDVFSGPDPWTELDQVPPYMVDQALALVYSDGTQPRWVFLRILGPENDQWSEDINYYYQADGALVKRERHFQTAVANMEVVQTTFYDHGTIVRDRTRHEALAGGKQKIAAFTDEPAPDYLTVDDLPFPEDTDSPTRFVSLRQGLIQIPNQVLHVLQSN